MCDTLTENNETKQIEPREMERKRRKKEEENDDNDGTKKMEPLKRMRDEIQAHQMHCHIKASHFHNDKMKNGHTK